MEYILRKRFITLFNSKISIFLIYFFFEYFNPIKYVYNFKCCIFYGIEANMDNQTDLINIYKEIEQIKRINNSIFYASTYELRKDVSIFFDQYQMDMRDCFDDIIEKRKSLIRFGDGELRLIFNPLFKINFQKNSYEIGRKLKDALLLNGYDKDKLIVGLPTYLPADYFQNTLYAELWPSLSGILRKDMKYASTHMTRPLIFQFMGQEAVKLWRRVWKSRNVKIVTGEGSRFELEPDLFSSAKSIEMIFTKAQNAFESIDEIKQKIIENRLPS